MWQVLLWQMVSMLLLATAFFIFDSTLALGQLQYAVYGLWTLYAAIVAFLVNESIALIRFLRGQTAKKFVISGFIVGIFGAGLAALASVL